MDKKNPAGNSADNRSGNSDILRIPVTDHCHIVFVLFSIFMEIENCFS